MYLNVFRTEPEEKLMEQSKIHEMEGFGADVSLKQNEIIKCLVLYTQVYK